MAGRIEFPVVTPAGEELSQPLHLLILNDYLRLVEQNLQEQEQNIQKLKDQLNNLGQQRIGSMAQRLLLQQVIEKTKELEAQALLAQVSIPPAAEQVETTQP